MFTFDSFLFLDLQINWPLYKPEFFFYVAIVIAAQSWLYSIEFQIFALLLLIVLLTLLDIKLLLGLEIKLKMRCSNTVFMFT